jgi:hypothetical protein
VTVAAKFMQPPIRSVSRRQGVLVRRKAGRIGDNNVPARFLFDRIRQEVKGVADVEPCVGE